MESVPYDKNQVKFGLTETVDWADANIHIKSWITLCKLCF